MTEQQLVAEGLSPLTLWIDEAGRNSAGLAELIEPIEGNPMLRSSLTTHGDVDLTSSPCPMSPERSTYQDRPSQPGRRLVPRRSVSATPGLMASRHPRGLPLPVFGVKITSVWHEGESQNLSRGMPST